MIRKLDGDTQKTTVLASAAQSWRDKLNEKLTAQQEGPNGTPRNTVAPNIGNRFGKTSPGSTARKAKKGHRPG